ncbi:glycosyltransferase family 4 protein [Candidatus Viridilinea mediisalina]|uniref:Glycosyltransferase subfamily 4-like N-terminal domain-containing protein n=1 Tax=Candidatus Viridilinea mediisalina TaxID=2024553 RepID=A0A2A6RGL9_9CHLR|nr:glycosyltransferase family 4 protein [Candidatus Viridilinea mediisalina]PDW02025.1 hypothetical protein CJ255_16110 [Candidatus Viridilinea mediisalina]
MKLCFIADARSPIAQNWISYFVGADYDVHVISSYPCASSAIHGASIYEFPLAFARFSSSRINSTSMNSKKNQSRARISSPFTKTLIRDWVAMLDVIPHVSKLRRLINTINPDLVHAMRIPFEGIAASMAVDARFPLLVSVWGNDYTLHAKHSLPTAIMTRRTVRRTDAIHCDCERDLRLSFKWGFRVDAPSLVVPTAGGIQSDTFFSRTVTDSKVNYQEFQNKRVVINPRGIRGYMRNDVFFRSIPRVLHYHPDVLFVCPGMAGDKNAINWVKQYNLEKHVVLLPSVKRDEMAELFRLSEIMVSPSIHDGTPNSLLEAMSCGCFPVVSALESVKEWITDQDNGLFFDITSENDLADKVVRALDDDQLRNNARLRNIRIIQERADYATVMPSVVAFYRLLINSVSIRPLSQR